MPSDSTIPIFTEANEARAWSRSQKKQGKTVAFVPTMGYLHEGHLSLVALARQHADVVIASIYVNPTQFSVTEDFDVYPRDNDNDRLKLSQAGVAAVFEPKTLYHTVQGSDSENSNLAGSQVTNPDSHETYVTVERLQLPLCGGSRPHFFRGVATVVTKLFHIVEPDVAVFGKKDYQQWRVITRMVRDLDFPIQIIGGPISREADGLAMSSRNARLHPEARPQAVALHQGLSWAKQAVAAGTTTAAADLREHIVQGITAAGGTVDYVQVVDSVNLQPVSDATAQPTLIAIAAHFPAKDRGTVRLIDNMEL